MKTLTQPTTEEKEIPMQNVEGSLAELVTRAEYDVQITTAKKFPRSVRNFINQATEMATLSEQTANDCIYALPRDGKTIEGPSARFGEIILHAWGHVRAGARIVHEDDRFITAQGVCHDLQSNTLIAYEVRRRITGKGNKRFNDDMIGVTGNAASSIALRNAILKVIPKAFWDPIYQAARQVVMGDAKTLVNRRADALAFLQKFGATPEMVYSKLAVRGVEEITLDHLVTLRGLATAIKEGDSTVEQIFADEIKAEKKEAMPTINLNTTQPEPPVAPPIAPEPARPELVLSPTPAAKEKPKKQEKHDPITLWFPEGMMLYPEEMNAAKIVEIFDDLFPGDKSEFREKNARTLPEIATIERQKGNGELADQIEKIAR